MKSPAFQFYPDDFVGSGTVGTATTEEVGIYTLLLCLDWSDTGFTFDAPRLARWCRTSERKFLAAWSHLNRAFPERDGRHYNPRLEAERVKQQQWREKSSAGGKKSAKQRETTPKGPSDDGGNGGSKGGSTVVEPDHQPEGNTPFPTPYSSTTHTPLSVGHELMALVPNAEDQIAISAFLAHVAPEKHAPWIARLTMWVSGHDFPGHTRCTPDLLGTALREYVDEPGDFTPAHVKSFVLRTARQHTPRASGSASSASPYLERAAGLYKLFLTHGFCRVQSLETYKAKIDELVAQRVIGNGARFMAELQAVKPWSWLGSVRSQDERFTIAKIAKILEGVPPALSVESGGAAA